MNARFSPLASSCAALAAGLLALAPSGSLHAQETAGAIVIRKHKHIDNVTVTQGTTETVISFNKFFRLDGVSQQVVRFNTIFGNMDVQLSPDSAPKNVANFLSYVNSGAYTNSFFHRSIQDSSVTDPFFIIQGGGFTLNSDGSGYGTVSAGAPVVNEATLPNARGTLAAARGAAADSATSGWFFNNRNNSALFNAANNKYTVLGQIIGNKGYAVMDQIAAVPIPTGTGLTGQFTELPLIGFIPGGVPSLSQVVKVNSVAVVPLISPTVGQPGLIKLKVNNSNPALVTASFIGSKLHLVYDPTQTGVANIAVKAKGPRGGLKVRFTVTVAPAQ